jgi:8-amino-7-oxononanoate synthase
LSDGAASGGAGGESERGALGELVARAEARLAELDAAARRRTLRPSDPEALDLTTNDYLGLRGDLAFQAAAHARAKAWPVGAGGSRLLGGELPVFAALEDAFARHAGAETALYLSSGFTANLSVMTALARLGDDVTFFSDALNHASLIDGMRLAGLARERRVVFPHGDLAALERSLAAAPAGLRVIVSETIFSMDGDVADVAALARIAKRHDAVLVLDEAHATFCYGPGGRGAAAAAGVEARSFIGVHPCGKAFGAAGALVTAPAALRALLVNTARPFIYSTGASPWVAAALQTALDLSPTFEGARLHLARLGETVRTVARDAGLAVGRSTTHIVPILVGTETRALAAEARLAARGVRARAIRPPTVPQGACRLRLSLTSALDGADVARIAAGLRDLGSAKLD